MKIKKFEQYNESIKDLMKPKSTNDINSVLNEYIKKIENALNYKPYQYDAFTTADFVKFISNFYGCNNIKDTVIKLMELKYIDSENVLYEWIDGVNSVSGYSEGDSKEQLKNFLETIKELR